MVHNHFGVTVGHAGVGYTAYKNLRNRLISVGFVFKSSQPRGYWSDINMSFPEQKES